MTNVRRHRAHVSSRAPVSPTLLFEESSGEEQFRCGNQQHDAQRLAQHFHRQPLQSELRAEQCTGTGGAIFLTPLLLFAHWMPTREASGTSVAFVWINSLTGLAGLLHSTGTLPTALPLWLVAVGAGALLGTQFGLKWLPVKMLRQALGVVLLIAAAKLFFA